MRQIGPRALMLVAALAASLKLVLPDALPFMEGLRTITGQDWMTIVGALYLAYTSPTQITNAKNKLKGAA